MAGIRRICTSAHYFEIDAPVASLSAACTSNAPATAASSSGTPSPTRRVVFPISNALHVLVPCQDRYCARLLDVFDSRSTADSDAGSASACLRQMEPAQSVFLPFIGSVRHCRIGGAMELDLRRQMPLCHAAGKGQNRLHLMSTF